MIYKINKTGLKGSVNFFSVDYRSINPIQNGGGKERGGGVQKRPLLQTQELSSKTF